MPIPKYQAVAEDLRFHILHGKYAEDTTLPTEFEICNDYQVSRQTVRQALSLLVKEHLIEKRQGSGSHILRQHTSQPKPMRSIAVVATYISDYIFPSVLREIETVLSVNNCTPSLFATQNQIANERKILQTLLSMQVDGILVEGTKSALPNPNLDLYQKLMDKGVPLVFFHGTYSQLPRAHFILDDNEGGGKMLTEYLIAKGHKHIAGIFKSDDIQGPNRFSGYIHALRDANILVDDRLIFWYNTENKNSLFSSDPDAPLIMRRDLLPECTAVVCYNDEIASLLISALQKKKKRIPEDIAVVSFDNSPYSQLSPVPITSLSHGSKNVGKQAAEKLLALMSGKSCQSELVPWELIERESG